MRQSVLGLCIIAVFNIDLPIYLSDYTEMNKIMFAGNSSDDLQWKMF